MIQVLSWNIQNGEGVDGKISLNRIADTTVSYTHLTLPTTPYV